MEEMYNLIGKAGAFAVVALTVIFIAGLIGQAIKSLFEKFGWYRPGHCWKAVVCGVLPCLIILAAIYKHLILYPSC